MFLLLKHRIKHFASVIISVQVSSLFKVRDKMLQSRDSPWLLIFFQPLHTKNIRMDSHNLGDATTLGICQRMYYSLSIVKLGIMVVCKTTLVLMKKSIMSESKMTISIVIRNTILVGKMTITILTLSITDSQHK